jgi:acetylornithine deacetylase/succinyl-diaminopimelate desuccinylase-like protein
VKHTAMHPLAGQTVKVTPAAAVYGHSDTTPFEFCIEDWNDRVFGQSWMDMSGHPASLGYAMRSVVGRLPLDNEVVYGKDEGGLGHLVHVSEFAAAEGGDVR